MWQKMLVLVLVLTSVNAGLAQTGNIGEYGYTYLETLQGATINTICQQRNGLIWLGTSDGLISFDGYEVKNWKSKQQKGNSAIQGDVTAILPNRDGTLWTGTSQGAIALFNPQNTETTLYAVLSNESEGSLAYSIEKIFRLVNGYPCLQLSLGKTAVWNVQAKNFTITDYPLENLAESENRMLQHAAISTNNELLMSLTSERHLKVKRDNPESALTISNDVRPPVTGWDDSWILRRGNQFLIHIWGKGLFEVSGDQGGYHPLRPVGVTALDSQYLSVPVVGASGELWCVSNEFRLFRLESDWRRASVFQINHDSLNDSLHDRPITSLFVDRNQVLWAAVGSNLYSVYKQNDDIKQIRLPGDFSRGAGYVLDVSENPLNSTIYLATVSGLYSWDGTKVREISLKMESGAVINKKPVLSVLCRKNGDLLIGTEEYGLLSKRHQANEYEVGRSQLKITEMTEAQDGIIWIADREKGLTSLDERLQPGRWISIQSQIRSRRSSEISEILPVSGDEIWYATRGNGLARHSFANKNTIVYQNTDALQYVANDYVYSLSMRNGNILWINTANGINILDLNSERMKFLSMVDGLPSNRIYGTYQLSDTLTVLSSNLGVYIFNSELSLYHNIYSCKQGMLIPAEEGIHCSDEYGLIIAADGGFLVIDRELLDPERKADTPLIISSASTEGQPVGLSHSYASTSELQLRDGARSFSLSYILSDFRNPQQNAFKYKLHGIDTEWKSGLGKAELNYSRLPPGTYELEYSAANALGNWTYSKKMTIKVIPSFWETTPFQISIVITVIIFAFVVSRVRTGRIKKQRNKLQQEVEERKIIESQLLRSQERLRTLAVELTIAEEKERRKIASILHDKIGQSLMMSKARLDQISHGSLEESGIDQVRSLLNSAIKDTRSLTVEVSPPTLHKFGLEAALEGLADKISTDHGLITVIERNENYKLESNVAVLLYQSARELLFNVVKHAKAQKVSLSVGADDESFTIIVADDGTGFDVEKIRKQGEDSEGFGLFSIEQRMESIGGRMDIISSPGEGTEVWLSIPLQKEKKR